MKPSTKQFVWKDRYTATSDFLQLVYHAPPYIRNLSAQLLPSFRSSNFIPQFRDIVLDETLDAWLRIYMLRACTATASNTLIEEFAELMRKIIEESNLDINKHETIFPKKFTLSDLFQFVDKHPINRHWFFEELEKAHPAIAKQIILASFSFSQSTEFKYSLSNYLLKLLETHPEWLDMQCAYIFIDIDSDAVQIYLDNNFDKLLELSLKNPEDFRVIACARKWAKLRIAIKKEFIDWHSAPPLRQDNRHINQVSDFETSPVYLYLFDLYEKAKQTDYDAYSQLIAIAQQWQGNISIRSVAIHFIGKLGDIYDVFPILAHQIRYGTRNGNLEFFEEPIRFEAGEALLNFKQARTWELLVDSYFINPNNDLLIFQEAWIAYLTDVLSDGDKEYQGIKINTRWWFRELANLSMDDLIIER